MNRGCWVHEHNVIYLQCLYTYTCNVKYLQSILVFLTSEREPVCFDCLEKWRAWEATLPKEVFGVIFINRAHSSAHVCKHTRIYTHTHTYTHTHILSFAGHWAGSKRRQHAARQRCTLHSNEASAGHCLCCCTPCFGLASWGVGCHRSW